MRSRPALKNYLDNHHLKVRKVMARKNQHLRLDELIRENTLDRFNEASDDQENREITFGQLLEDPGFHQRLHEEAPATL
jgi:hypothetical protein